MLIGELSKKTGFSKDTIRFYEQQGLLDAAVFIRSDNNYRNYTNAAIDKLNFIRQAKKFGFTLKEIKKIIAEWDSVSSEQAIDFIQIKIERIEENINQLKNFRDYLLEKKARLQTENKIQNSKS